MPISTPDCASGQAWACTGCFSILSPLPLSAFASGDVLEDRLSVAEAHHVSIHQ